MKIINNFNWLSKLLFRKIKNNGMLANIKHDFESP